MGNFEARFTQDEEKQQELAMRMADFVKSIANDENIIRLLPSSFSTEALRIQMTVMENINEDQKLSIRCLETDLNEVEEKLYKSK